MGKHPNIVAAAVVVVFALATFGVCQAVAQGRVREVQQAQADAASAEQAVADAQAKLDEDATKSVADATGVDAKRVASDSAKIEQIAHDALTWSDYATYKKARERVIEAGIPADSQFLTDFMPEVDVYETKYGEERNAIDDAQANTKFSEATTYCMGFDGDAYTYACVATAASTSGSTSVDARYIITCTTGADGISDVQAIQIADKG